MLQCLFFFGSFVLSFFFNQRPDGLSRSVSAQTSEHTSFAENRRIFGPFNNSISPPTLIPEELSDPLRPATRPPPAERHALAAARASKQISSGNRKRESAGNKELATEKNVRATTFIHPVQIYLTWVYF